VEVSLRQVTKENYEDVCELDVTKEQKNKRTKKQKNYVACNMWSIVESNYNEGYETRVIYMKEEPVDFFMWVKESEIKVSIWRFMIDKKINKN
jgi:diamine N-acetyltransferase